MSQALVVGGGAIGVACAFYLHEAGFDVTLVERDDVGRGCSYANAGLIVPGHSQALPRPGIVAEGLRSLLRQDGPFMIRPRLDPALAQWLFAFRRSCAPERSRRATDALTALSRMSLELFDDLVAKGRTSFGFAPGPLLNVYCSDAWRRRADAFALELEDLGFRADVLERDTLVAMEPALGDGARGGLAVHGQASGDCFAYVRSLADGLGSRGVHLRTGSQVRGIVVRRGRAAGVMTARPGEELAADLVVVAAGAWASTLTSPLGLDLPIQPATGYSATLASWDTAPRIPLILDESHVVVLPLGDRVRFAGTLELAGFRRQPDPTRQRAVVRAGRSALREPPPATEAEPWYGFRPLMPDDLPAIGWVPGIQGVLVAAGHGTLGFTQSPATGRLIAELATGATPSLPLAPFSPSRFDGDRKSLRRRWAAGASAAHLSGGGGVIRTREGRSRP